LGNIRRSKHNRNKPHWSGQLPALGYITFFNIFCEQALERC